MFIVFSIAAASVTLIPNSSPVCLPGMAESHPDSTRMISGYPDQGIQFPRPHLFFTISGIP
jgi:hypothetical protein